MGSRLAPKEYEADGEAWCAILAGAGSKAFSAGGDLVAYEKFDEGYGREGILAFVEKRKPHYTGRKRRTAVAAGVFCE